MFIVGGKCSSHQQVVFVSLPLKWAEQTGLGVFKHSLQVGTHEATEQTGSSD